jgi:hypothetical protein
MMMFNVETSDLSAYQFKIRYWFCKVNVNKNIGNSTSAFHVLGLYEYSDWSNQALIDA